MIWVEFLASAGVIVYVATQLAKYGDVIAVRTRLGGMLIGLILLAGATSLPELLTTINSIGQGVPDLAAGNLFGSNMFNMFMLAILDLASRNQRVLRKAALKHALSGSLAIFMIGLAVFFIMVNSSIQVGWVGGDSLALVAAYVIAIRLLQLNSPVIAMAEPTNLPADFPSLVRGLVGFGLSSIALILITPILVRSSAGIAEVTGLGTTFVGTSLVAIVTSLPEMVTTLAALKIGADDMAIGNLFGSNLFNMFALGLADFFYTQGRFLGLIDPSFLVIGMLGLLMTGMGLIGNLARLERRIFFIELDALALILTYLGGMVFLFVMGISP